MVISLISLFFSTQSTYIFKFKGGAFLRKANHGSSWKAIVECGIWELKANLRKKRKYHEKKILNIGPVFGTSTLKSQAVYLRVKVHWMQKLLQSRYFLGLEVWDHLLMTQVSKWSFHSAVLIKIHAKHLFFGKKGDRSQKRREIVALIFL